MGISDVHRWLGTASGGAGPVFRWIWASLIVLSVVGIGYLLTLALE